MALKKLGLPPEVVRRAAICAYEGEINMLFMPGAGVSARKSAWTRSSSHVGQRARHRGRGKGDAGGLFHRDETVATSFRRRMGLPNMKRYSDEFNIDTVVGKAPR
jgi:hypothetical protein